MLNAEQASTDKVAGNKELQDIVSALGCGIGADFDLSKLRYGKIFLLMDADCDGHHISTLLLTFFYRHLRPLIEQGHVFIAQPPLYRIDIGKETYWALDEADRDRILKEHVKGNAKPNIMRFKGLGEMNADELKETTLDPKHRARAQGDHRQRARDRPGDQRPDGQGRLGALQVHHGARRRGQRARRLAHCLAPDGYPGSLVFEPVVVSRVVILVPVAQKSKVLFTWVRVITWPAAV